MGGKYAYPSTRRGLGSQLRVVLVALTVVAASLAGVAFASPANALSGSTFNRGDIITDANFFNPTAMTQSQIQAFLDKECPTNNCINVVKSASTTETSNSECPGGYTGLASETTAAILYKVQRLCGISARVLLVTLQKEQGLVTAKNPSAGKLRAAMGYACPDTAPCSSSSLGFFRQIYDAAWQFQEYRINAPNSSRYPIGAVSAVRYSPNAACGSVNVRIQNAATRGLYIYTPYTPNAAALANLGGIGNSCSSYGNRNFWAYYSTWFGDPTAGAGAAAIGLTASAQSAALGAEGPVTPCAVAAKVCSQAYANGVIYWTAAGGPWVVVGANFIMYKANGGLTGPFGVPTSNSNPVTDPHGNGSMQSFTGGDIHTSASGTFVVLGAIMTEYSKAGWLRGPLGWPTAQQACATPGRCTQTFAGGTIYQPKAGSAFAVAAGAIATEFASLGGASGSVGFPAGDALLVTDPNGNGSTQAFQGGVVHSSSAGTFLVTTAMMKAYSAAGWLRGSLGWPTADQVCTATGCSQTFTGGTIELPTAGAGYVVPAVVNVPIKAYWTLHGAAGGALGNPTAAARAVTDPNGNGFTQAFQSGVVHSSATGTFLVTNAMMKAYSAAGWLRGSLGWPTGDQVCTASTCTQAFQAGTVTLPISGGTAAVRVVSNAKIKTYWTAHGAAAGALGYPAAASRAVTDPNGNGFTQAFQSGVVHSSTAGTFLVTTAMMKAYSAGGWLRGSLGWPTADQACTATGCSQTFTGGTIELPTVGAGYVVPAVTNAQIKTYWTAHGAAAGALGNPAASARAVTDPNGNGFTQAFQSGVVHSSVAGTFLVTTAMMTAYSAGGWLRGPLGWPIADQVCTATTCTQAFHGGTLHVAP